MELWPCRFKQELVVGNVSKWLEEEEREGMATHKWMLYVRGGKHNPDISAVVSRVEVGLPVFVLSQVAFFFFRSSCTPPTLRTTWSRSQLPRSTSHAEDGVRFSSLCTQHVFFCFSSFGVQHFFLLFCLQHVQLVYLQVRVAKSSRLSMLGLFYWL